jgi:uncharacterized membrane protein
MTAPRLEISRTARARGIAPEVVFFIMSLLFGAIAIVATPPLRGPDEPAHLWRTIGISEGDLIPTTRNADGDVGLFIPANWHRQFSHFNEIRQSSPSKRPNYWEVFGAFFVQERTTNETGPPLFLTYEGSQAYSPIPYVPYAAAAVVARVLGFSFLETLYLLRFVGLLVTSLMIAYAIAVTPFLKRTFLCIAMLPTALYQRSVISIDGVVLATTLIVIALCLAAVLNPGRLLLRSLWIILCSLTKPPHGDSNATQEPV